MIMQDEKPENVLKVVAVVVWTFVCGFFVMVIDVFSWVFIKIYRGFIKMISDIISLVYTYTIQIITIFIFVFIIGYIKYFLN